jgi:hypothetical protein
LDESIPKICKSFKNQRTQRYRQTPPPKKMKRLIHFKRERNVRTKTEAVKKENN